MEVRLLSRAFAELLDAVVSLNAKRRHLSTGQKTALAVDLLPLFESNARERQRAAGRKELGHKGDQADRAPKAAEQAASAVGIKKPEYLYQLKQVRDKDPEAFAQVKAGTLNVPIHPRATRGL